MASNLTMEVPKGDIFYPFSKDVEDGNLSTVSWLTAPANSCRTLRGDGVHIHPLVLRTLAEEADRSDSLRVVGRIAFRGMTRKIAIAFLPWRAADTTANEYTQDLPGSVKQMVGSVYKRLTKKGNLRLGSGDLLRNATNRGGRPAVSD